MYLRYCFNVFAFSSLLVNRSLGLDLCLIWFYSRSVGHLLNINTAALVTIVWYNTLVAGCSRQLVGPADWVFVSLGHLRCA